MLSASDTGVGCLIMGGARIPAAAAGGAIVALCLTFVVMLLYTYAGVSAEAGVASALLTFTAGMLSLQWLLFWLLVALIGLPVFHAVASRRRWTRFWIYALAGVAIPLAFMAVIQILSPHLKWGDFVLIGILCGALTGLVFWSLARETVETNPVRSGRVVGIGAAIIGLAVLVSVCASTWRFASGIAPLHAEIVYRWSHPTWPYICGGMESVQPEPALADPAGKAAACRAYADAGDAVEEVEVADGKFGHVSPDERAAWLEKAVDQDYEPAIQGLASMLSPMNKDQGIPKDGEKALRLYLRSAEKGNVISQLVVAVAYKKGVGVGQDMVASLMWCEVAAMSAEAHPSDLQLRNLRKGYEDFAAQQPPEQVAEAHRRAQEFLARHDLR
jgi:hypothetical protein